MTNLEKLNGIFCEVFSVDAGALGAGFDNKSVEGWDSVRQLSLTAAVEDSFDIMLDPEDILEFTSYDNAKTILAKYDIEL
ncbi:Acyl carrier protein [Bacteroidales bacterium WCE2004]|jgi:acyl carrier protein|nr:acyl carrier protein [Bacteroidales bacterium]SKC41420.1 Acyl carrier protein [Bacteroidales bacterium WCE2004]